MWLSEQPLKSQAVNGKLEQPPRRGLLEGFSLFVNDFLKASRNFSWDILHKKTANKCENHQGSLKSIVFYFNFNSSCDTIP
jgi:hypothetical protein